jgi:succinyl-diaminopimelate desuccinylase
VGVQWLRVTVRGCIAHAGRAERGVNANHLIARIIDRVVTRVAGLSIRDPILRRPLVTCGRLEGGLATIIVAPFAWAEFDFRLVPGFGLDDALQLAGRAAVEVAGAHSGAQYELAAIGGARPPVQAEDSPHIVAALRDAHRAVTGRELETGGADGHEAYTDAAMIAALTGSRCFAVFGPGSNDQAHVADESVAFEDLRLTARVLETMVNRWVGHHNKRGLPCGA